jgi:hypothetical protein
MFKITSEDGKKLHHHLLFITKGDEANPISIEVGEANNHTHAVDVQFFTIDPITFQQVPLPQPSITFSMEEGHTHEMGGDVELEVTKPPKKSDEDKVAELRKMFEGSREYERDSRKKAQESVSFYEGRQWERKHSDALNGKGRVVLTINHIENAVDTLSGYFRQNRTDFKFFGVEKSDNVIADITTEVVRNICERNEFAHVETCVFEDEVVPGRGLFHSYIDFDDNVEGDIKIERYEWDDVYFSQHNKADASDAEHMSKSKWYSKDKLKSEYPDKADDIQADFDYHSYAENDDDNVRLPGRQYDEGFRNDSNMGLVPDFVDLKRKEYRVIETEQKQYSRIPILTRIDVDEPVDARDWNKKDVTAAKSLGFSVIRRPSYKMRVTKFAGNVLLDDYVDDEKIFSITPVYAKKRKDSWYGKVESAKDPQRELNKLRSQQVDIVNKMTVNGWFMDRDTFSTPQEKRKFERESSAGGFMAETNGAQKDPRKVEASPLPSGLLNAMETSRSEIKEILNVTPEVLNSKSTSGLALIQGQKMALLGSEYLYDNMAQSKKRLGIRIVHMIQKIYTPERIMRILTANAQRKPLEIGGEKLDPQNQQQMDALKARIEEALNNDELTSLDLVVGETSHSPNKQLADFSMNLEMARVTGGGIPIEMLIESSPMSEDQKAKAMQSIERQKQAAAQAEQQKIQSEIEKSQPDAIKMQQAMQRGGPPQGGMPPQGQPPMR